MKGPSGAETYSIQVWDGRREESSAIESGLEAVVADQFFVSRSDLALEVLGGNVPAIRIYLVGLPDHAFLGVREPPEARMFGTVDDLLEALLDLSRSHGVL